MTGFLRAEAAPRAPTGLAVGHVARYQLAALAIAWLVARTAWPHAARGVLVGGLLVAMNLQLSRAMLPLLDVLRARASSPQRAVAYVGAASLAKLLVQLTVAAWVLLTWPPAGGPFLVGMGTFLGGVLGAAAHAAIVAQRGASAAAGRGLG